ncbi:thimet oligopeptidase protein [Rutstroemia sp. NJR-2017a BVV2]|nr:thimet oligopeptidase protein [Rutstroemia sp. NJR-2017a BVV2]
MTVHQPDSSEAAAKLNPSKVWNTLRSDIMPTEGPDSQDDGDEWGHHEVTFRQLAGDNDAGNLLVSISFSSRQKFHRCLQSSQVYSLDIFDTFFKSNPMDATEGRRYRRMVLENGGSIDEMKMLEDYLGRKPNSGAFYRELGCSETAS